MELGKMKYIVMLIAIPLIFIFQVNSVKAEQVQVESTGYYVIGDGPDEKISTAKERARVDAMRMAAEKGGVFVEGISEVKNSQLTKDEINVITAQIMQINKEDIQPVVDGKYIKYVCHIVATIDTSSINISDYIANKRALNENVKLQEEIARLREENLSLKQQYQNSGTSVEKERIAQQIKTNENDFKKAVVETLIINNDFGTSSVDSSTINYDEAKGMITFKVHTVSKTRDNISTIEVDIKRNCLHYLDSKTKSFVTNKTRYDKANKMRPIYGNYAGTAEVIKVYNYLGIEPENMYRNADWIFIYQDSDGTKYYIDIANTRYDSIRALGSFPIKRYNEKGLYEFLGRRRYTSDYLFYYDYTYGKIGIWNYPKIDYNDPFLYDNDIISACKEAKKLCLSRGRKASLWEQS